MAVNRSVVQTAGPLIGFSKADISARSLQADGAMAILMARVDPDTIRLVRSWQSDTMLRYLHTTAKSFTKGLSAKMFEYGSCAFIPEAHAGN